MRDPDKYRHTEVNRDLHYVYKGEERVGQIRRGLDRKWYAEIGVGDQTFSAALHRVMVANEAVRDLSRVVG
jgi:hypothetical protein